MNEKTDWTRKKDKPLRPSAQTAGGKDGALMKTILAIAAGGIVALLARGVKKSDYYDRDDEK